MALTFGALTSDRVDCGNAASLNDLDPFTVLMWLYPTSNAVVKVYNKILGGIHDLEESVVGNLNFLRGRATTNANYITNDTPLSTLNAWVFIAVTFNSASTPSMHIYKGSLTSAVAESSYGLATNGAGTLVTDATSNWMIGNKSTASTLAFKGRIGHFSVYNAELSNAQCEAQRLRQFAGANCKMFHQLGFEGIGTQLDRSGNANNGTVTGATAAAHHPYLIPPNIISRPTQAQVAAYGASMGRAA